MTALHVSPRPYLPILSSRCGCNTGTTVNFRETALGCVNFMMAHSIPMTPTSSMCITLPSALFALMIVDLQLSFSVSLYLLFHKNWRSVLMKDLPLCRSVMKTLSNRFGGTQGTFTLDSQANNMSLHNCIFPQCLSLSPCT